MVFWGSTIDSSKAKLFEVPLDDNDIVLPPHTASPTGPSPTTSKVYAKPTAHLPGDHGTAQGENSNPAFPSSSNASHPAASYTPDEGWFSDMSNLVSNQKWFFIAVGAVVLFGISAAVFFWRRRVRMRQAEYTSLPARDDLAMSSLRDRVNVGPRTKELYDAFGELSDDDDADESTRLRPGTPLARSGFDEPSPSIPQGLGRSYRDEPDEGKPHSPDDDGSNPSEGSWVHAS